MLAGALIERSRGTGGTSDAPTAAAPDAENPTADELDDVVDVPEVDPVVAVAEGGEETS